MKSRGFIEAAAVVAAALLGAAAMPACAGAEIVALDVGHTSAQPGATSARGRPEYEFNRALTSVIDATLRDRGIRTAAIGKMAPPTSLQSRTSEAAAAGATFFLAVHHDSAQPQFLKTWDWGGMPRRYSDDFSGFSLFVSRKNPDPIASLRCASAIGEAMIAAGFHPSPHHAVPIPGENREWADQAHGVYYFDDLVVLKTAESPAILLEAGVIINRADEVTLERPETQVAIAQAVADGFAGCKRAAGS